MSEFDAAAATKFLEGACSRYGADLHKKGGGVMRGTCSFDSYFAVDLEECRVSMAIRKRKDSSPAYIAVRRKSEGRNVVEDRFPIVKGDLALSYFDVCVKSMDLVATYGMHHDPRADDYLVPA